MYTFCTHLVHIIHIYTLYGVIQGCLRLGGVCIVAPWVPQGCGGATRVPHGCHVRYTLDTRLIHVWYVLARFSPIIALRRWGGAGLLQGHCRGATWGARGAHVGATWAPQGCHMGATWVESPVFLSFLSFFRVFSCFLPPPALPQPPQASPSPPQPPPASHYAIYTL